ncbi:serine/threonine-protein kinase ATG1c-like isoform X2 [Ananas comosus]|uniref:Serine/threonine-protein kinase ATG1c-like isoform X2 n=1 Tax=Ananas comosus TaxID=4615 RepID=A0A6P5GLC4_ANACO|nr:serine/threonine-protein kinase ATG1c-like isoform X2 [Ananas comosus]
MANPMAASRRGVRVVGNYLIGPQIGSGMFSVVWLARHRMRGTEVAVKEIVVDRLSDKLKERLLTEVFILKRIKHPNIIALRDFFQIGERIYLVLEYCRGGDLSMYMQRHGRVSEAIAKHFLQQLASGLQVLCKHNVVHRDLKPQNLLLLTKEEKPVLKIADFGFARSLQPCGLAETLCGTPLYMAPEVMQVQKYDAKADLWSVGIILFQLVTGQAPFNGSNQIQLLQNIVKSNELPFPRDNNLSNDCIDLCKKLLRRNPVERLMVEEFANHKFLSVNKSDGDISQVSTSTKDGLTLVDCSPMRSIGHSSHKDTTTCLLDNDSMQRRGGTPRPSYGIHSTKLHLTPASSLLKKTGLRSMHSSNVCRPEATSHPLDSLDRSKGKEYTTPKDGMAIDWLERVDEDFVVVTMLPRQTSSSGASLLGDSPYKSENSRKASRDVSVLSIEGVSRDSPIVTEKECIFRVGTLQHCASAVNEVVKEEIEREFIHEVGRAEELASEFVHIAEATDMPDGIEIISLSALTSGRLGAVDEMMGNEERATNRYSKAVDLLHFLLVEAPSLALKPPLTLTSSLRRRLWSYIDTLNIK